MNIDEIARISGVSKATVSRVINKSELVKPETREKVQKVIDENGFTPSAIARSLSVQNTMNVGVIFPDLANPFYTGVLGGITTEAEAGGYNVFLYNSDESPEREHRFLQAMRHQRVEGVIVTPVSGDDVFTRFILEDFERNGLPVVLLDRDFKSGDFSAVMAENMQGAYNATKQLITEGHERIAIIEGSTGVKPIFERTIGYFRALQEAHIPTRDSYILKGNLKSNLTYELMEGLMGQTYPPTAIFSCNNMMTLGCLRYLTEKHLRIGRDVSLIGFDDIETLKIIDYGLSVVDRSEREMGSRAMRMLKERIAEPNQPKRVETIPTQLILRGSERWNHGEK